MPRDGGPARLRLQQAALELYQEHGYDQVTTAEIAARAGVTERTFYRHFADKREVLFDGEKVLRDALVTVVAGAPESLAPLPVLLRAFRAVIPMLERNRPFSEPRRHVIAATPALRERAQAKTTILTEALATALRERGVSQSVASLAAQIGMAAFGQAAAVWFNHPDRDPDKLLSAAFEDIRALGAPLAP
ncbi:TetR/AcrR family transcriptional regulator [Amycolatopsis sp. GM8]|uniref:TetR/AcrR family transcriptional regulator n=1 Tax=Amycolatopsis sp. GM8 TaxID=2896530 RepID=UPI001F2E8213|nr:TetR/AcrR family transcriptional regulator [Amycolatopsis sp. GM8]